MHVLFTFTSSVRWNSKSKATTTGEKKKKFAIRRFFNTHYARHLCECADLLIAVNRAKCQFYSRAAIFCVVFSTLVAFSLCLHLIISSANVWVCSAAALDLVFGWNAFNIRMHLPSSSTITGINHMETSAQLRKKNSYSFVFFFSRAHFQWDKCNWLRWIGG